MPKPPKDLRKLGSAKQLARWATLQDRLAILENAYQKHSTAQLQIRETSRILSALPGLPAIPSPLVLPQLGLFDAEN